MLFITAARNPVLDGVADAVSALFSDPAHRFVRRRILDRIGGGRRIDGSNN